MSKFDSALQKTERAKFHIQNLQSAVRAFHETKPYKIGTKRDPQTRKLIYHVLEVTPVPGHVAVILGDALQNLRTSLDHVAHQLWRDAGHRGDGRHVQFPIAADAAKYVTQSPRMVEGIGQPAVDAIRSLEPYKGGNGAYSDALWRLNQLNNIDKHRLLITVGSAFQSVNLGAVLSAKMASFTGKPVPIIDAFFRPADRLCPLKAGDELYITGPDEPNENPQFRFNVALNEPGVVDAQPFEEVLIESVQAVDGVIAKLTPLLS